MVLRSRNYVGIMQMPAILVRMQQLCTYIHNSASSQSLIKMFAYFQVVSTVFELHIPVFTASNEKHSMHQFRHERTINVQMKQVFIADFFCHSQCYFEKYKHYLTGHALILTIKPLKVGGTRMTTFLEYNPSE